MRNFENESQQIINAISDWQIIAEELQRIKAETAEEDDFEREIKTQALHVQTNSLLLRIANTLESLKQTYSIL